MKSSLAFFPFKWQETLVCLAFYLPNQEYCPLLTFYHLNSRPLSTPFLPVFQFSSPSVSSSSPLAFLFGTAVGNRQCHQNPSSFHIVLHYEFCSIEASPFLKTIKVDSHRILSPVLHTTNPFERGKRCIIETKVPTDLILKETDQLKFVHREVQTLEIKRKGFQFWNCTLDFFCKFCN